MAASAKVLISDAVKTADENWTIVRRSKQKRCFPKYKSPVHQHEQVDWAPTDLQTDPDRECRLMKKMQVYIEKLEKSEFFAAFLDQVHSPEFSDYLCKFVRSEQKLKMVIYGIGSIESFESPRLQLSLAILMKRKLNWIGDIEVFDPIISLTESKVLQYLGCSVLSVNEHGRREALKPILFFMPHCEVDLYDNLLNTNWRWDMLNQILLLGNSFTKYEQQSSILQDPKFFDTRKHVLAVRRFTKEFEIRTVSDDSDRAFHGSSWHFFDVDPESNLELTL